MKPNFKAGDTVICIDNRCGYEDVFTIGHPYIVDSVYQDFEKYFCDIQDRYGNEIAQGVSLKRFEKLEQPQQTKNMKLKCINAKDSNSLIQGDTYTKVDTNEHGNISVMTSKGRILQHYYKPDRFVEVKEKVSTEISLDKKYQTKNGLEVKLLVISDDEKYPVVGQYKCDDYGWQNQTWTAKGELYAGDESELNLVEAKPDEYWFNDEKKMKVNRKDKSVLLTDYSYSFEVILALAKEIGQ